MNVSRVLLSAAALCFSTASAATYTVRSGDTLYSIAQALKTDAPTLMRVNKLSSSTIAVGQHLETGSATPSAPATASTPTPVTAPTRAGGAFIRSAATRYLGIRYALGGTGNGGIDCSGFTLRVFQQMGINLPRTAASQWTVGAPISRRDLQAGDLVFFNTMGRTASHVGIYLGDGMMAGANSYHGKTMVEPMFSNPYWASRYDGARRVVN